MMSPPTSLAFTAFYSQNDWEGWCWLKWISPTQPTDSDAYYRVEYHEVSTGNWIWQADVPPRSLPIQNTFGIGVKFATAPPGGTPKTIIVDTIRVTAKDANGNEGDSAPVTINTPTSLTLVHVPASNFFLICSGVIGQTNGAVDLFWDDPTMFVRNGRVTLSKYGTTSPGIKRILYDNTFSGSNTDYGPNRAHMPITLFPPGVQLRQSGAGPNTLQWDPFNPIVTDPAAPFWVVENDLLTVTITTSADGDTEQVMAEFTFAYHREVNIVEFIDSAIVGIKYQRVLEIAQDPFIPIVVTPLSVNYITGLPPGLTFDPSTLTISSVTGPTAAGNYVASFVTESEGGHLNEQFVTINVTPALDNPSGYWPVMTSPPPNVTLIRGEPYPQKFNLQGPGGAFLHSGTLPAGLVVNLTTGIISGTPTNIESQANVFNQMGPTNPGPNYPVNFSVVEGLTPNVLLELPSSPVLTATVFGTVGTTHYTYLVVANFADGAVAWSNQGVITTGNSALNSSNYNILTWTNVGAATYDIYLLVGPPFSTGLVVQNVTSPYNHMGGMTNIYASPPAIQSGTSIVFNIGDMIAYPIATDQLATDYQVFDLPDGMVLQDGVITGIPDQDVIPGNYVIWVQAKNQWGWGPLVSLLIVIGINPPEIFSANSAIAIIGENFFYQIVASNQPMFYGAYGLPDGLEINPYTGIISGVATGLSSAYQRQNLLTFSTTDPQTFLLVHTVKISAINQGGKGLMDLALSVQNPAVPVIDSSALNGRALTLQTNEPFTFQASASNNPTRWSANPLPQGLNFDSNIGKLSGQFLDNGLYSITFVATNVGGDSLPVTFYFMVGIAALGSGGATTPPIVPIDVTNLWVDIDTGMVSIDSSSASTAEMTVKRGDSTVTNIIFHRQGVPTDINLVMLYFGAKVAFDDDYIVFSNVFQRVAVGTYRTYPDFSDQNNDLDSILVQNSVELIGEVQWDVSDGATPPVLTRHSTLTFGITVLRDLLHPDPDLQSE
jgi:hypothetical protein